MHHVTWTPPPGETIKFNCDGSVIGTYPCGAIGVVIRNSNSYFLGAIVSNIGHASPLEAEFSACMSAIERAQHMNLHNICLETDSLQVVNAFNKEIGVPWHMRSIWYNCLKFCSSIICSCVHTHRAGILVADALAKHGQGLSPFSTQWWPSPPPFIHSFLLRDSLRLPFSRLVKILFFLPVCCFRRFCIVCLVSCCFLLLLFLVLLVLFCFVWIGVCIGSGLTWFINISLAL